MGEMKDKNYDKARTESTIWQRSSGGVFVPTGTVRETSSRASTNFLAVKQRAQAIEQLYAEAGVALSPASGLGMFIENAKRVSDSWLSAKYKYQMTDVFTVMHMYRIADAVLNLVTHYRMRYYLKRLLSGEVDFFKRVPSDAKNVLWELELWSYMKKQGAPVDLKDPPDVIANLSNGVLGIACKKIYSEANIEKTLSQAVQQVKDYEIGVVAMNIDDMIPAGKVLAVDTPREANRRLLVECEKFLKRHEKRFRKYLSKERLGAALISVRVIAEVRTWDVPFNNYGQTLIWALPDISPNKRSLTNEFGDWMIGRRAQ